MTNVVTQYRAVLNIVLDIYRHNIAQLKSHPLQTVLRLLKESRGGSRRSSIILLFLSSVASTGVISSVFLISKLYNEFKDDRDSRPLYRRNSSVLLKNGAREIFVPVNNKQKRVIIKPKNNDLYERDQYTYKYFDTMKPNGFFYSKFINQLTILWRILIPKVNDKNTVLLLTQVAFLILRTYLSLYIAKLDGSIVKDIISGNGKKFIIDLCYWFLVAFPASYTNSAIKYLVKKLSLNFRMNLTRYIHDMYLDSRMIYYKVFFNDKHISNIDQFITQDVDKFCDSICSLFSNLAKPAIDLVVFSIYLRDNLGTAGIAGIFVNYFITGSILKMYTPPFGKLSSKKSEIEGDYYAYHLNLINNSEEIAFYKGTDVERSNIEKIFAGLQQQNLDISKIKFSYSVLEDYILKYTWSALGYMFASIPIFLTMGSSSGASSEQKNMKQFIVNKRLMLSMADAGSRLMYSIKDISKLTGYTDRVFKLMTVLHHAHSKDFDYGSDTPITGTVQDNYNGIRFENINVKIPGGSELVHSLSFQLKPRDSLLILGGNNCGKTSIERIIAGLWPVYSGLMSKPNDNDIMCLPQKPYFSKGSLRDQIIYPFTYSQMIEAGYTDLDLVNILKEVKLDYLLLRDSGWKYLDAVQDWKDVLSGGEKQRVNFARVLFKNPRFIILDESTNAISMDIEDYLFNMLRRKRFTFITVSQRPLLIKHHDYLLEIDQKGDWNLKTLGSDEVITSMDQEIHEIEENLQKVSEWETRRNELIQLLA